MQVRIPWWRVNRNHIRGIHACALATGAELCSGLSLLEHIDPKRYRLIMRSLHMDYHYQAKTAATATASPAAEDIARQVLQPLESGGTVDHVSRVELHDAQGNHLASATITWQVKRWDQVRTRK
jgi:acyl-coenzyme A thioesterase PaaI-like protein